MRRPLALLIALATLVPTVILASGTTATARTAKRFTLSPAHPHHRLLGSKTLNSNGNCNVDPTACDTFPFRLRGVTHSYLANHHVVLDVLIQWKKPGDGFNLFLENGAGAYIRSSQTDTISARQGGVRAPLVQHVAVWLRPDVKFPRGFRVEVDPLQDEGGYRGRVALVLEKPHMYFPSANFRLKNLSVVSKLDGTRPQLTGAGEPSLAIGPHDAIYVSAPLSVPAAAGSNGQQPDEGVALFRSSNHGRSWTVSNQGSQSGGGDSDIVTDTSTGVYLEDLAAATITTFKSTDKGKTFTQTQPVSADTDREWMGSYLPNPANGTGNAVVYTAYHGLANQNVFICTSTDGGQSNTCQSGITDPAALQNSAGNTNMGSLVVDSQGNADFLFATSTPNENANNGGTGPLHILYVGHYDKATGIVTDHLVYNGPTGHWITGLFPILAIDKFDHLYAFWPESKTDKAGNAAGPWALKLSHSTDGGATWSTPIRINPPTLHNNLLNWITVGDTGKIDVIWAGTHAPSNQYESTAKWYMFFAQSVDGLAPTPHFTYRQITPFPIRYGSVCVLGLFCPGDDSRSLLDFAQVEVDQECRANVVFGDGSAYIPALTQKNDVFRGDGTATDWALQGSTGKRICTPGTGGAGWSGSYMSP